MATDLIQGVDLPRLIGREAPGRNLAGRDVGPQGVNYRFIRAGAKAPMLISIGVWASIEEARGALEAIRDKIMIGPSRNAPAFSDESYVWNPSDPKNTSVLFRRVNTVVFVAGDVPEGAADLARRIDTALTTGSSEVTRSDSVTAPRITAVEMPESIWPKRVVEARIKLDDGGAADVVFGTESTNVTIRPGTEPVLVYHAPAQAEQQTVVLAVANSTNAISTFTLPVRVQ